MKKLLLFHNLTIHAWKALCQRFWLLAVLSMLFLLLPLCAGPVAEELLSQGVAFSGLTIGVVAPEGDDTGKLIQELTGNMRDVSRYARLEAMDRETAFDALEKGEVSAVLILPENFVGGILEGANPDVQLLVSAEQPLEALLTYWVGYSAADLLTSAQRGIYAVLERFPDRSEAGVTWEQAMTAINLRYVNLTLNRQDFFRVSELSATGALDIKLHYGLSLLLFLLMVLPPLFCPLFDGQYRAFHRRLRSVGCGPVPLFGSRLLVIFGVDLAMLLIPGLYLAGGNPGGILLAAVFGAAWTAVCCQLTRSSALCGGVSFATAGVSVVISGGVLPQVLLPGWMGTVAEVLPVSPLRQIMALPADAAGEKYLISLAWTAVLLLAGLWLGGRETAKEGGA